MSIDCTHRSREAHEHREALIEAFIEYNNLAPDARIAVDEIIEADRLWVRLIDVERELRETAVAALAAIADLGLVVVDDDGA
jgi:hypothetical protein